MAEVDRWKATVHVAGLAPGVTTTHVQDAFLPFGDIVDVTLPKENNSNNAPHRGYAYVEFEEVDDAKEAIDNMHNSEFFGRVMRCTQAKPPKNANEGLGSKKAIWEQDEWIAKYGGGDAPLEQEEVEEHIPGRAKPEDDLAGPKPAA